MVFQPDSAVLVQRAFDKPLLVGVTSSLSPVGNTELPIDVRQVELDGLLRDPELFGDLLVRQAACERPEDDSLTTSEAGRLGGARRGRVGQANGVEDVALDRLAQSAGEVDRVDALHDVCAGATLEDVLDQLLV